MIISTWKSQRPPVITSTMAARSTSAMVKPLETAGGPYRFIPVFNLRVANAITKICMSVALLLACACGGMTLATPVQGAETGINVQTPAPKGPLTFDDSVGIAINHSPYFKKSSTEIEIRKMDESDSRFGMIPTLTFSSVYYVNHPTSHNINPKPYSLSFVTNAYNPVVSYLTLQGNKLATQAAILSHLKIISLGLQRLGDNFLELGALKELAAYQKEVVNVSRENLTYAQKRLGIGTGTRLDVKLAQQELQVALGEQEQMAQSRQRILAKLRDFIGLKPGQKIVPNLQNTPRQVLGNFTPATASLSQAKKRSYDLKIMGIQNKLQRYNIKLAIARIFPTITLNTQTPDPLSNTDVTGLYFGVGVQVPVWDGFSRIRNVSRQKAILRQYESNKTLKEDDLADKWRTILGVIQDKKTALKVARAKEEVARLKAHQDEIRYHSGEIRLPVVLASRQDVLEAEKDAVQQRLDYNKAVLKLRQISGDLGHSYVHASTWQN
jgi:outer membrane protein TolC